MTSKIVNSIKTVFVFGFVLVTIISCEKDFEDIGVNLVDNNIFSTQDSIFEVIAYNQNVVNSEVIGDNFATQQIDGLPVFSIGILNDPNFGILTSSFISQLQRPGVTIDFGLNPVLDTVILDIPYFSTRQFENNDNGSPQFELDSVFGDLDQEYVLKVNRLRTFLNTLDPADPTVQKRYFSDETYQIEEELYSGNFKPNASDTVLYITRRLFDGQFRIDTIKKDDLSPSIKLPLDTQKMEDLLINNISSSNFESNEAFNEYFRGIMVEAIGQQGALMILPMSTAAITVYYTNEELTDETTVDLNGDGDTDDTDVPINVKRELVLQLSGIRTATYVRDYSGAVSLTNSFANPDRVTTGESELFVSGAAGSNIELEFFKGIDLQQIRNEGWLINGAILDLYVDDVKSTDNLLPNRLYIYNSDDQVTVQDAVGDGVGGFLDRDDQGNPEKYSFVITEYISDLLKEVDPRPLTKLAIKVHHITDNPSNVIDTIIRDFSWKPKGVVLKGNVLSPTNTENTRLKLRIFYTEQNNN